MAISASIVKVYAARLVDDLVRVSPWANVIENVSSDVASGAEKVDISSLVTVPTIRDYVEGTPLQAPERLTDAATELTLNRKQYFNAKIEDTHRFATRPDFMGRYVTRATQAMANSLSDNIRAVFNAGVDAGRAVSATAVDISDATEDATKFAAIKEVMQAASARATAENWPREGRWAIVSPLHEDWIARGITLTNAGQDQLAATFASGSIPNPLYGWNVLVDSDADRADDGSRQATTDSVYFGCLDAAVFAVTLNNTEAYRPENDFADAIKGLMVHGAMVLDDSKAMFQRFTA